MFSNQMKNLLSLVWEILKGYFLEIIIFLFSIILVFVNSGFLQESKSWLIIFGLGLAFVSCFSKIQEGYRSKSTSDKIDNFISSNVKKDERLEEAHKLLKESQDINQKRSEELEEQNDLITRLIKKGLISEKNIYGIIQRNRFIYLFCYQNVPEQEKIAKKILKRDFRNPSLEAVEEIGFVKVGVRSNLYVIPFKMLPAKLNTESKIEDILKKLVKEKWDIFLSELESTNKRFYKKYKDEHGDITNCSYMIMSTNYNDVIIDHIGYDSFSRQFKDMLKYNVDIKKLKKEISKRKHDIKEFIKSTSYELLLTDISIKKDRELIETNGDIINKNLKTDNIFEFKDKKEELRLELEKIFTKEKANRYSNVISNKSKKYCELFSMLGIEI